MLSNDEIGDLGRSFKNMTDKLMESKEKTRAILENVVDGIITIDEHGNIDSFNPACERIFGYRKKEVLGKNVIILMPDPYQSEHDAYLENYRSTGKKKIIGSGREVQGRRKNKETFPLELSVSEVNLHNRRLFSGILRDITERKQIDKIKDDSITTDFHR